MIELITHGIALIIAIGAGIAIGIYITTQISCWIDKNIKKDK
jgi:uncharacterized protein YneF (UPF0154 family)|tara:strand:- start:132 stop:257 length:126 start_codon:yes stop_codon:yes gene_type:complete